MLFIFSTFDISKLDKYNDFNAEHPANIELISLTSELLK